jgi:hypothetical protein
MSYFDFVHMLDLLARYYPRYHSTELLLLADDILKWVNHDLPKDSSTLAYLQSLYESPHVAIRSVWQEIQLMAGPYLSIN